MADVAIPLHGTTAAETYINIEKLSKQPRSQVQKLSSQVMGSYPKMRISPIVVVKKELCLLVHLVMPLENWD